MVTLRIFFLAYKSSTLGQHQNIVKISKSLIHLGEGIFGNHINVVFFFGSLAVSKIYSKIMEWLVSVKYTSILLILYNELPCLWVELLSYYAITPSYYGNKYIFYFLYWYKDNGWSGITSVKAPILYRCHILSMV